MNVHVYYMYMYVKHKLKTTFNDLIFLMHQSVHIHMFVYIVLVSPKLLNCGVFIKCVNLNLTYILRYLIPELPELNRVFYTYPDKYNILCVPL